MEQSHSSEANRFSASQEIPRILWNLKVHYHIYKCPPPVSVLSQLDPVHTPTSNFWRSILILSSHLRLGLPSDLFPSGFPTKTLFTPLLSLVSATWPAHLILLDFITRKILGEEYRSLSSSLCSFLHSLVTSSLLGPNILLNIPILKPPEPTSLPHSLSYICTDSFTFFYLSHVLFHTVYFFISLPSLQKGIMKGLIQIENEA